MTCCPVFHGSECIHVELVQFVGDGFAVLFATAADYCPPKTLVPNTATTALTATPASTSWRKGRRRAGRREREEWVDGEVSRSQPSLGLKGRCYSRRFRMSLDTLSRGAFLENSADRLSDAERNPSLPLASESAARAASSVRNAFAGPEPDTNWNPAIFG